jgi:hypothetical protein
MGAAIRPSTLDPGGFNFARPGLGVGELPELDLKLDGLLRDRPRTIMLSMVWMFFLPAERDAGLTGGSPLRMRTLAQSFYADPQRPQEWFLPGTRVARVFLDAKMNRPRPLQDTSVLIENDGWSNNLEASPLHPSAPSRFQTAKPGWYGGENLVSLQRHHDHWAARGVRQIFVFLPVHPDFRALCDRTFSAELKALKGTITRIYEGRVIDLENEVQEARFYADSHHVNALGARRVTALVAERMAGVH